MSTVSRHLRINPRQLKQGKIHSVNMPPRDHTEALERARYKLRQARVALAYLRQVPRDIAKEQLRARQNDDSDLRLDTFFFACLSLAQSAFYIVTKNNVQHKDALRRWRMDVLDEKGRTQFNKMMSLRDEDVHRGQSEGKTLATMIPIERRADDDGWVYQQSASHLLLGVTPTKTEHTNPDGSKVSSFEGLQSSRGLFIEIAGEDCEGSNACERFIDQMSSLIAAVEAVTAPTQGK